MASPSNINTACKTVYLPAPLCSSKSSTISCQQLKLKQKQPTKRNMSVSCVSSQNPINPIKSNNSSWFDDFAENFSNRAVELYARLVLDPYNAFSYKLKFQIVNFTVVILDEDGSIKDKLRQLISEKEERRKSPESYSRFWAECSKCLLDCQDRWVHSRSFVSTNCGKFYDKQKERILSGDTSPSNPYTKFYYVQTWRRYVNYDKNIVTREDFKQFLKQLNASESEILSGEAVCMRIAMDEDKLKAVQGYSHLTIGDDQKCT